MTTKCTLPGDECNHDAGCDTCPHAAIAMKRHRTAVEVKASLYAAELRRRTAAEIALLDAWRIMEQSGLCVPPTLAAYSSSNGLRLEEVAR